MECQWLLQLVHKYELASTQKIKEVWENTKGLLSVLVLIQHEKYLGSPSQIHHRMFYFGTRI